jgi:hypothetical protein
MPQSPLSSSPRTSAKPTSEKTLAELLAAEHSSKLTRVPEAHAAARALGYVVRDQNDPEKLLNPERLLNFLQRRKAKQPLAFLKHMGESRSERSARNALRAHLASIPENRLKDVVDEYLELHARKQREVTFAETLTTERLLPEKNWMADRVKSKFEGLREKVNDIDSFDRQIGRGEIPTEVARIFPDRLSNLTANEREAIVSALQQRAAESADTRKEKIENAAFQGALDFLVKSGSCPATEDDALLFFEEVNRNPQDPKTRELASMLSKVRADRYVDLYDEWKAEPARQKELMPKLKRLDAQFDKIRNGVLDVDKFDEKIEKGEIPKQIRRFLGIKDTLSDEGALSERDAKLVSDLLKSKLE